MERHREAWGGTGRHWEAQGSTRRHGEVQGRTEMHRTTQQQVAATIIALQESPITQQTNTETREDRACPHWVLSKEGELHKMIRAYGNLF